MQNKNLNKNKKKVAVGMSGGVDSSVCAFLLKELGYEVEGFFMKFWSDPLVKDGRENKCCSAEDNLDAQAVASKLGIRLNTLNLSTKFKENIVDNFISAFDEGVTPNPCVRCNQFIKMGGFWEIVKELGFDYISTGHYAKIIYDINGNAQLTTPKDLKKDQTYFLYRLNQETLLHTLFPLSDLTKDEVKEIALKQNLITAKKKDSQELCFLANNSVLDFFKRHSTVKNGDIINIETNEKIGTHNGLQGYTIGQRKGIGLNGGPWFVVKKNIKNNFLYVTNNPNHELLFYETLKLKDCTWPFQEPILPILAKARVRYNQELKDVEVFKNEENIICIKFLEPMKSISKGQSAVIYKNDVLLGGGVIV